MVRRFARPPDRSQAGHRCPLQALGLVDGGQVDRVDKHVGLPVEVLVGALGVVAM
jgi:hypothetical protein